MKTKSRKPATKAAYHHGDLARALLDQSIKYIDAHGIADLSLRDLAREIGVSHAAPYRHFADKKALLVAIADQGYQILFDALRSAFDTSVPMLQRMENMAWTYVKFAIGHPVHLTLMFDPSLVDDDAAETPHASDAVLEYVKEIIRSAQSEKVLAKGDVLVQTASVWSMVHGLAMLLSSKCMEEQGFEAFGAEELTRRTVKVLFEGMART